MKMYYKIHKKYVMYIECIDIWIKWLFNKKITLIDLNLFVLIINILIYDKLLL